MKKFIKFVIIGLFLISMLVFAMATTYYSDTLIKTSRVNNTNSTVTNPFLVGSSAEQLKIFEQSGGIRIGTVGGDSASTSNPELIRFLSGNKLRISGDSDVHYALDLAATWTNGSGKPSIGFLDRNFQRLGYITCHNMSRDGTGVHKHCSWEVLDSRGDTNTHFAITWGKNYDHNYTAHPTASNNTEVTFPGSQLKFFDNQPVFFGSDRDMSFRYNGSVDRLVLARNGLAKLRLDDLANGIETELVSGESTGFVGTNTEHGFKIKTNASSKMIILANGNVGINQSFPENLFEVGDNLFNINRGGNVGIGTLNPSTTLNINGTTKIESPNAVLSLNSTFSGSKEFRITAGTDGFLTIRQNGNVNTGIAIDGSNGFFGIGTENPVSRLSVNGTFTLGDGTVQRNITMTSPDGSEGCCGMANDFSWSCSAGACA